MRPRRSRRQRSSRRPIVPEKIERFDVGETPEDPTELNTDTLTLEKPAQLAQEAEFNDASEHFEHRGGGMPSDSKQPNVGGFGGFDVQDIGAGPSVKGKGGVGVGIGTGTHPGSGGSGWGFGGRGSGSRKAMLASGGGTKQSERAVAGALNWLARHQLSDGSWSLSGYRSRCKDHTCTGPGKTGDRPAAATALALLPFLGRRTNARIERLLQEHHRRRHPLPRQQSKGQRRPAHWRRHVRPGPGLHRALRMLRYEQRQGYQAGRAGRSEFHHGVAESSMTAVGVTSPTQPGDLSVSGWQIMALKSGQMAYLTVTPSALENVRKFLKAASFDGRGGGRFAYQPGNAFCDGIVIHEGEIVKNDDARAGGDRDRAAMPGVHARAAQRSGHGRRHGLHHEVPARHRRPQHLLLVLRHASDAQPDGPPTGTPGTARYGIS